ncbi:MAG: DUF2341 domain-containing protein, partial [Promethearchaeota archaeon]
MSKKNLYISLVLGIFLLNIFIIAPPLQDDFLELGEFFPSLLRGFGFKSQKKETNHKISRLLSSSQVNQSSVYSDKIHFAQSEYFVPGWADTRWKYRKNITIDHTKVDADLTNFPIYIELYDSDLQQEAQASGNDILFTNASGHLLNHEIEVYDRVYNSSHSHLVVWVNSNLSSTQDTIISMYYGNPTAVNQEYSEDVWDDAYVGVWHLSEDPTDSSPAFKDSTPNNNDGTDYGSMTSGDQVPGQIDGSLDFDGDDDYLEADDSSSLTIPGSFTVSAWINTNDLPSAGDLRSVVAKGMPSDNPGENHNYGIMLENAILTAGQAIEVYYEPSTGWGDVVAASWVTSLSLGQWYHVVGVHDAGADTLTLFINGIQRAQNTGATATPDTGNAPLRIADVNVDWATNEFNGQIDEVRVSNTVRNTNWIQTEYNNQNDSDTFYSVDAEEKYTDTIDWHYPGLKCIYRKEITIDSTKVSGSSLSNFP